MKTRLNRQSAIVISFTLVVLIVWGILAGQVVRVAPENTNVEGSDLHLYMAIADRVSSGENYYEAAIQEQIARGYPVMPSTSVRTPVTTVLVTALGEQVAYALMIALIGAAAIACVITFERVSRNRLQWIGSSVFFVASLAIFGPIAVFFQETWAVLLIVLSICIRGRSLTASITLALLACGFRELAFPFILAMAMADVFESRKREAIAWVGAGIGYLALYAWHAAAVSNAVEKFGGDSAQESPGWLAFGGWPFIVGSVQSVTPLSLFPLWVSAVLVPLALLGWLLNHGDASLRFTLAVLGYVLPFLVIGRPNNDYWALLYAPLLLPGMAYSFSGLRLLVSSIFYLSPNGEKR